MPPNSREVNIDSQIAILHYASPPTVGGVESIIAHHARGLADRGILVRVITGEGGVFDERVETHLHPLFGSRDPRIIALKQELDQSFVSAAFAQLVEEIESLLHSALSGCDVCIVHNAHTLHKNLALTAALSRLRHPRLIAWCHDLAWTNPLYRAELHEAYPWTLLRKDWPNTRYVTISEARQVELAELLHLPAEEISVIPPGIDAARFLQWTEITRLLEDKLHLLDADIILLLPARLTRRKNIELALHVLAALRQIDGQDYRLIVTGPPGPHNPANLGYLGELLELRQRLGLVEAAHFLYEVETPQLVPDDLTMANLYQLADALFFPSLQEGFGIPLLEAGLVGLPIFCSTLPPFQQIGQSDVMMFQAEDDPPEQIAQLIQSYFADNPRQRLKNRVRHQYRWDTIIASQLIPLLEG